MEYSLAFIRAIDLSAASEEDLACRVQDGCKASFSELARRLQPRLLFVLRRRLGNASDAEDVAQKTLLRAFEKIRLYDPTLKFSPWLFTIAIRLATDHHRKTQLPIASTEPALQVADPRPGPAEVAVRREYCESIWTLAEQILKPDQWTALWLLYGEGQTVREVARSLNRTTVSVRVLVHRARKKLAPHLAKFESRANTTTVDNEPKPLNQSATLHVVRAES
ncbi:MAG: sigma-70 family RNA polymerase sigma factor [Planctomycetota bacterium]